MVTIHASFLNGTQTKLLSQRLNELDAVASLVLWIARIALVMNSKNPHEQKSSWLERVEDLIAVLEGSTIGELELSEAGMEVIIRRRPSMMLVNVASLPSSASVVPPMTTGHAGVSAIPSTSATTASPIKEDRSVAIVAPLTGVYYSSPSPTSPPFVAPGDIVYVGQVVALIEAMKVFNEIQAEVSGRVVALTATTGDVVQKGSALLRVEPT